MVFKLNLIFVFLYREIAHWQRIHMNTVQVSKIRGSLLRKIILMSKCIWPLNHCLETCSQTCRQTGGKLKIAKKFNLVLIDYVLGCLHDFPLFPNMNMKTFRGLIDPQYLTVRSYE